MIPPCDPRAGYLAQQAEIDSAVLAVLNRGSYILGSEVEAFENEFAGFIGTTDAVGVANGTDAIHLSLRALGIGSGDGVLTVSHTAVATVAAIEMAGAVPVLVDVDPRTYTMCPESLSLAIARSGVLAKSLKAIVPVHLYGHPADMAAICSIAKRNGLRIVEDCAQSHGAAIGSSKTGAIGDVAAFSLYPTKNLGAFGDAGIVTTSDPEVAENLRLLRQYGWKERNKSQIPGVNSRLDEIQAAILRVRLRHLNAMNKSRRVIASIYDAGLRGSRCELPHRSVGVEHVFHQYVLRFRQRDGLQQSLRQQGVLTLIHYPTPVHAQPAYSTRLAQPVSLQNTERIVQQILSLPMFPELAFSQAQFAVDTVCRISEDMAE
jgi:dTDP-4-amino-4,6-dideoxygalactose transaminase